MKVFQRTDERFDPERGFAGVGKSVGRSPAGSGSTRKHFMRHYEFHHADEHGIADEPGTGNEHALLAASRGLVLCRMILKRSRFSTRVGQDGTRVLMFITYRKGIKLNGNNPTYLYGYGGFDISLTPSFSPAILAWMEMGGILRSRICRRRRIRRGLATQAGMKLKKQNVFDDFVAAGEWLIANHYTRTSKLAIGRAATAVCTRGRMPDANDRICLAAALPAVGRDGHAAVS